MKVAFAGALALAQVPAIQGNHGHKSSEQWLPRVTVPDSVILSATLVANVSTPANFDWRNVNGQNYVTSDWNQHIPQYCGSCWIHGTLSSYNDRLKIRRGGKFPDVRIARQAILNCVPDAEGKGPPPGCNGGDAWMIHEYMRQQKMPDETCMPYQARNMGCDAYNVCRNCITGVGCYPVKNYMGYGVSSYGKVSGEQAMMKEIYARGPIVCSFATDDPWMYNYSENVLRNNGVYTPSGPRKTAADVDHDMEVAGWGETASGEKYWIIRNSWGTYWGEAGWAKLKRGTNELMVESDCAWAEPTWDELDESLEGKVLGDYMTGIGSTKDFEKVPWTSPVDLAAAAKVEPSGFAVVGGAFCAGAMVAALAAYVTRRASVRGQPSLLG